MTSSRKSSPPSFLADLLAPGKVTPEQFFDEYWQKKPLHIEKPSVSTKDGGVSSEFTASAFQRMFSIEDMEEMWHNILRGGYAGPDSLLVFKNGKQAAVSNPFFAFANDHSVVVNKGDRFSSAIYNICKLLEADTFPFVFTNVYLTPPHAQTVPAHSDDREVLLLQIAGSKEWTVYDDPPVELPYKNEEVGKRTIKPSNAEKLPKLLQKRVCAGDVLYLPRGYVHEAKTTEQMSLHLTVALQSSDWDYAKLITSQVSQILRSQAAVGSRKCLPVTNLRPKLPVWARRHSGSSKGSNEEDDDEDDDTQLEGIRKGYREYNDVVQTVIRCLSDQLNGGSAENLEADGSGKKSTDEEEGGATGATVGGKYAGVSHFSDLIDGFHSNVCGEVTQERDAVVENNLRMIGNTRIKLATMIIWNKKVRLVGSDKVQTPAGGSPSPPPAIPYLLHFDRQGDSMSMGATDHTGAVISYLFNHHQECPISVAELSPMSSDLARLCLANLLLGNGCCLRVSS